MRIFLILPAIVFLYSITFAHPGRTDSKGGHYDRKTGEYHYHNSESKAKAVKVSKTVVDSNSPKQETKEKEDEYSTIEKLQSEIKSLRVKVEQQEVLIERLRNKCVSLHKHNRAMKQLLTDANIPIPKVEIIRDSNEQIEEPNEIKPVPILEPNSASETAKN